MREPDSVKRLRKLSKLLEPYMGMDEMENYSGPISSAIYCMDDFDYECELMGNTAEAFRLRYEQLDGAAIMMAYVFGLDISYARQIMHTHQAWYEYETALEKEKECEHGVRKHRPAI